jgi:hypothetical protein
MALYDGWDGEGDYEAPVKVGNLVRLTRGDTVIVSRVEQTKGFFPGVVALEFDNRLDLKGWDIEIIDEAEPLAATDVFVKGDRIVELAGPTMRVAKGVHIVETLNGRYLVEPTPREDGTHMGRWIGPPDGMDGGTAPDEPLPSTKILREAVILKRGISLFGVPYVPKADLDEANAASVRVGIRLSDALRERGGQSEPERVSALLDQCDDLERERDAALRQRAAIAEQWAADKVAHAEQVEDLEKRLAVAREERSPVTLQTARLPERVQHDVDLGHRTVLQKTGDRSGVVYVPLSEFNEYRRTVDQEVVRYRQALVEVRGAVAKAREILGQHDVAEVPPPRPT